VQHPYRAAPKIALVDPPGSSLYNKVKFGVAYASQQSEQRLRRHRYDTLAEGIGLDRITANFGLGCIDMDWSDEGSLNRPKGCIGSCGRMIATLLNNSIRTLNNGGIITSTQQSKIIDDAVSITDQQAVYMAHYLLRHEGLFVGSSTAMNIAGAMIVANAMPPGSNVVTVVCDGGQRHTARFWNREFIEEWGLTWPGSNIEDGGDVKSSETDSVDILKVMGIA
jgi:cysteine synthase A